jgi:4-hydroxybenzoyl-CoA reductase subunit alpha
MKANYLGGEQRKIDGEAKATGRILYTDDITLPNMLMAKIKRSAKAHAKIKAIHVADALSMPGVKAVITGQDMPHMYGVIPWTKDEYPLCVGKVLYVGDAVAAVAAIDEETANRALKAIRIDYEDLPQVLTTDAAKTDLVKVNEHAKVRNITKSVHLKFGDVEAGFKQSAVVVDDAFAFHATTHTPIEPHCAIGDFDSRGMLQVYSSTQVPHYLHRSLAEVLELPESAIRVIQPAVGGAFGGKSEPFDLEFVVAKLSMLTGQPVKCLYTREEVFLSHRGRHAAKMRFRVGADKDGIIKAVKSTIDLDGGAYASFGLVTAFYAGQLLTAPTGFENYEFEATRYYTNKPAAGPKRGHGSVQPRFAFEVQLDQIAEKLGMDPIELRRRNAVKEYARTVNGQMVGSMGVAETLDEAAKASRWNERRGKLPHGHGLGVASSMYISGTNYPVYPNDMPQSAVMVKADRSGRITLFSGASDIGQGSNTMLASIACEELGVPLSFVNVVASDTDLTPVDLGAYSSRVTLMAGLAAQEACQKLRLKVAHSVCKYWQKPLDEKVIFDEGQVVLASDTSLRLPISTALQLAEVEHGALVEQGSYRTTPRGGDYRGGTIGASPAYSCTAHVAEVFVDVETGKVRVENIWVAHDCGRALNRRLVTGQMEGSTYMGFGEVFLEDMRYGEGVRAGILTGPSLLDYRIPTSMDTPKLHALIVEKPDPNGPYGAKEAGEGPLHSTIPAIANAIYNAVGIRLFELPFTPAKVKAALLGL